MSLNQTKCIPDFAMAGMLIVGIFKENIFYSILKSGTYFPFQFVWAPNPAVPASFADFYES